MTVPAWRQDAPASSFAIDDDDAQESPFYAGERICAPPLKTRGSTLLPACLLVLLGIGGWALVKNPQLWQHWLPAITTASAILDYRAPPVTPPTATEQSAPAIGPTPHAENSSAPPPPEPVAANAAALPEPLITASIETAPADKAPSVAPLAPPKADLTDPYQRRAAAVGLHPDLSRALLTRLSPADFRNAGEAIETAVAKTPDAGTFVWPRQRRPEQALFQVHFVPGAAPDCRRYVVTVTKDRWSTTALPMERCGAKLAARKGAP
jgi:hypothetical protein